MDKLDEQTPIIVGVGQVTESSIPKSGVLYSGNDLAAEAARRAILNAAAINPIDPHIDVLTAIRFFEDSTRKIAIVTNPLGASNNVPGSIAKRLDISPRELIYAAVGGQSPQRLVNESCERIYRGEIRCALITGAEAIANIKYAVRNGIAADWSETIDRDFGDRWSKNNADNMVSEYEMAHGLFLPVQAYPLFENAYRGELGNSVGEHRKHMARLFAPFSRIAANNPFAQFPRECTEDYLATPSAQNYLISEPYCKWLVAQDAVNQGAAVLLTSIKLAKELGIPKKSWVFLHGYADVDDENVVNRPDLSTSYAQRLACTYALNSAGKRIDDIEYLDIYSCFPIAVTSACEALGIDPFSRALSLTGGLPYFGGPGNNYSMHAIAETVMKVRGHEGSYGLVVANGGYLSKHSVGIYSSAPPLAWAPIDSAPAKHEMANHHKTPIVDNKQGQARIETYVAAYQRGTPNIGYVFARMLETGERIIAKVSEDDQQTLNELVTTEPMGREVTISRGNGVNIFRF